MLENNGTHHAEALFAQLERISRNPVRLYRHLLQRAVAQLDAVAADAETLRATVRLLQKQRRQQEKCISHLQRQLMDTQEERGRAASRHRRTGTAKNGHTHTTPLLSTSSLSSPSLYCVHGGHLQPRRQKQQGQREQCSCGRHSTLRELRGNGKKRHTSHSAVERTRNTCRSLSHSPSPTSLERTAPLSPSQQYDGKVPWRTVGNDGALIERVLGDVLLLLLDDEVPTNADADRTAGGPGRLLLGNAKTMYDSVMSSVRILKKREGALKCHLRELEETLRRDKKLRLKPNLAEEQHVSFGVLPSGHDSQNIGNNNNNNNSNIIIGDDDDDDYSSRQDASMMNTAPPAYMDGVMDSQHTATHPINFSSLFSVGRVDSKSSDTTTRVINACMYSSADADNISHNTQTNFFQTYEKEKDGDDDDGDRLDDLAGEEELLEYAKWKDSFLRQYLPSK
ncbi:hypothetical protein C3747_181g45 [Trypanosoma cruzi]|uniref:Uncharacterized protein n=2 Tax=Trypanosoma cruzi TaxID=5693 RepID=Q4D891_TRYCC|nr:hypothetical protein, conserved [Trypanosoma cruzi]EAN88750.1 hypothetical protein, conserved [Trypanosoma cruzi]PWV03020.1 hypothetical protein C3747_181g45 [Trypanosoma cruzi]RNC45589.1 hypothetical protein TcCL_NonESM04649 [Trypanosoma cruzi]|eukprot:XP_810601.1 hypothetical protein [Trypanosoma cruzi strain CL Brener]